MKRVIVYRGFIKFWRKSFDNEFHPSQSNRPYTEWEAWEYLLMHANHKERWWNGVKAQRGELLYSLEHYSRDWRWDKSKVRRYIKKLKKRHMIDTKSDSKTTHLTILNYCTYQDDRHESDTKPTRKPTPKRHSSDTQTTPTKELKNDKALEEEKDMHSFWDYFLLKTKKAFLLTKTKKDMIRDRFKDFSLDDLKRAADNFVEDDWEGRAQHLDLIYCIGKQKGKPDALEKWLNFTKKEVCKKCNGTGWYKMIGTNSRSTERCGCKS